MNTITLNILLPYVFLILCLPFQGFCLETDTLPAGLSIKDPDTIVSARKVFKLGFFTPPDSKNRYLAVFYTVSEQTSIWIANRDNPLRDSSGSVSIDRDGNLVLTNGDNEIIWSTNATTSPTNTSAQIQDTGNLVLKEVSTGNIIWDSFSHPSDVFLPLLKIIDDTKTGNKVSVSSWRSESDPQVGNFTAGLEALNIPQIFTWKNGRPHWRSGPWNGQILIGVQDMYSPYLDGFSVVDNRSGLFYFTAPEGTVLMKIDLNSSGSLVQTLWDDQKKSWDITWLAPQNVCDIYGTCGPFGSCNVKNSPTICSCLRGFEPKNKDEWASGNWTNGCVRKSPLQCDPSNNSNGKEGNGDGFLKLQFMKVPDFAEQFSSRQVDECRDRCSSNCSCIAYAHDPTIGCMFWSENLVDIQEFAGVGVDLYIRLAKSELDHKKKKNMLILIPIFVAVVAISIMIFIAWFCIFRNKGEKKKDRRLSEAVQAFPSDSASIVLKDESEKVNIEELPLFTFETLAIATDQFQDDNALGKGGFGTVYKGKLANGKEIAVKRLSAASGQGMEEFMNEVAVISKLQHRNLVRLVGCCVEKEEKMLIYEYMPNKSLDVCLFDPTQPSQQILTWKKRFDIIEGIGRGILYLHRDSRLRIIHRDLKPSNVLLDEDWNPKISDFGMARIFGGNQDQGNTARVVGTYGYMAPEYAMEGRFSEKSDVYSFGVLMLEIISGKKNTHYYNEEWSLSLLGCAWKLWSEDNGLAFADQNILSSNFQGEIVRCIHISLLCVQEFPTDRPTIQTILSMLSREIVDLPAPEQPVFAEKWNRFHVGQGSNSSTNSCTTYGKCGSFGLCNSQNSPICSCLPGFVPNNIQEWDAGNWTNGCMRRIHMKCEDNNGTNNGIREDGFLKLQSLKIPGYSDRWVGPENECGGRCLSNCSCMAYGFDVGIGCMFWRGTLMDIQKFPTGSASTGSDLYIRLAISELDREKKDNKKIIIVVVVVVVVVGLVMMAICAYFSWKWMAKKKGKKTNIGPRESSTSDTIQSSTRDTMDKVNLEELPLIKFEVLVTATDNFSEANKLGKGGFGPVFKGNLNDGREIAVKRLSKASGQGMQEFMNEVVLISKLQHRNLVRLLACCVENKETMLVYEYMPNKSLDFFLFDPSQDILDWRKRINIIEGIGRGLLYLHRDSRLKIIHRDLKPSNILLDNDWNPKISDFGMARIFGTTQDHVSTVRVVGTYGYMAPEYALEGRFSEKSDVFSFGVLILEIATGKRNTSFYNKEGSSNLLGHVWKQWNEDNLAILIDPRISSQSYRPEIMRCIHIGLLCVQELPKDRPSISSVLSFLSSEIVELPEPNQTAFAIKWKPSYPGTSSSQQSQMSSCSLNNVSLTMVDGR
ncbi:hypothetical protein F511_12782 [Dorcoceras hygrometricum]|uniref:non-specific serine/threonine protein kinase n=1 Tax=Dorcoceras hygrometricum TaxID=472368 RepID=A0A2Z7D6Z2_9LAMI|nr:hypothetical protein F511_12782 [Dorcoceras hygrometricum]